MKKTLLLLALLSPAALAQTTPFAQQPFERAVIDLLNEVRTKGTLQGSTAIRTGTCMERFTTPAWRPRDPLVYSPTLNRVARNHTMYMQEEWDVRQVTPGFEQRNPRNTHFTGVYYPDRVARAARELGVRAPDYNRLMFRHGPTLPAAFVQSLLEDREICMQLTTGIPEGFRAPLLVGVGYTPAYPPTLTDPNPWGWWAVSFGMVR